MDRDEVRKRALNFYCDELQYAIARDDEIDLNNARARAAMRLGRDMDMEDLSGVWLGYIEGIARSAERGYEVDTSTGQLRFDGALRVRDLTFVPTAKAKLRDWLSLDDRHETKFQQHAAAREPERDFTRVTVE